MEKHKGFSVVEVLIVASILSILCLVGYPSLAAMTERAKLKGEAAELISWMQRAKLEAIKSRAPTVIEFGKNSYRIFSDNSKSKGGFGDWARQDDEAVIVQRTFESQIEIKNNFPNGRMRFNSTIGTKTGTITLEDHTGSRIDVVINSAGRIRAE